jgi:hypothetical protein
MADSWFYDDDLVRLRRAWVEAVQALKQRPRDENYRHRVQAAAQAYFDRAAELHRPDRGARAPAVPADEEGDIATVVASRSLR